MRAHSSWTLFQIERFGLYRFPILFSKNSGDQAMIGRQRRWGAVKSRCPKRGNTRCVRGRVESLEPRLMLTIYVVDSLAYFLSARDPATIPADNAVTLREALMAASLDAAVGDAEKGTSADEILFRRTYMARLNSPALRCRSAGQAERFVS